MKSEFYALPFSLLMFIGMLLMIEVGRYFGKRQKEKDESSNVGTGVIEGSVFALMGLLIAFTFANSASRFDLRREMITQEANAIGTAYLRIDLFNPAAQPRLRELFREYLGKRLLVYHSIPDIERAEEVVQESHQVQRRIWSYAMDKIKEEPSSSVPILFIPSLNQMFDIENTRVMTVYMHLPVLILTMLFVLGNICALLAGYGMSRSKSRNWVHRFTFCIISAITFYVILDLEYPRRGIIRLDTYDKALIELKEKMK